MGVRINKPESKPAVAYDRVHLTRLQIEQPIFSNDALNPVYTVVIEYKMYGVVDGVRYYDTTPHGVVLDDFIEAAIQAAAKGNLALLGSLQAIEGAVAAIITEQTDKQAEVS